MSKLRGDGQARSNQVPLLWGRSDYARQPSVKRGLLVAAGLFVLLGVGVCSFAGVYSIQPIGAIPEGRTLLVVRASGEPFFNSPDAVCLERVGYVSLMCRMMALGQSPTDRILLRLPYIEWTY